MLDLLYLLFHIHKSQKTPLFSSNILTLSIDIFLDIEVTLLIYLCQYLNKNETLLNFLDLTWEQCALLGLESIYEPKSKEQRNREYYKRNSNKAKEKYKNELKSKGKLSKKEELKILRKKIKALRDKGFKNKEISIDLNISVKTLERHITYMRKNGLM